jgi:hypothetical protein
MKTLLALSLCLLTGVVNAQDQPQSPPAVPQITYTRAEAIPVEGYPLAPEMTPAERERMLELHYAMRDAIAARVNNNPPSAPGLPLVEGTPTPARFWPQQSQPAGTSPEPPS